MAGDRLKQRSNEGGEVELYSRADWLRWRHRSPGPIVEQEEGRIEWLSRSTWMSLLESRVQVHEAKRNPAQRARLTALYLRFLIERDPDVDRPEFLYGRQDHDRVPVDPDVNMDFVQKMVRLVGRLDEA